MNWELLFSILSLVTGGGCLIWIFNAGIWKGEVSTKLETIIKEMGELRDTLASKIRSEMGHNTTQMSASLATSKADLAAKVSEEIQAVHAEVKETAQSLRNEFNTGITRVHERLDVCMKEVNDSTLDNKVQALVDGLAMQRGEWDELRQDVRILLRSEATTTNEIVNFKARLQLFEQKMEASSDKVTRLQADYAHLTESRRK